MSHLATDNRIKAPFDKQQILALIAWQYADDTEAFVCPHGATRRHVTRGSWPEKARRGLLVPDYERGWICLDCDYTQDWAYDFMLGDVA